MERFYVFYTWAYGMVQKREEFDRIDDVLNIVSKAADPESGYLGLTVIAGEKLEFEPYTQITAWRVKE